MSTKFKRSGRPPKYSNEEKLAETISDYFDECKKDKEMPNKAGLCLFLGISRDTYSEYRKVFPDAIKKADSWIENAWVQRLGGNAPTGAIFYLKNAFKEHYKDKYESDITSGGEKITGIEYIVPKKPDENKDRTNV